MMEDRGPCIRWGMREKSPGDGNEVSPDDVQINQPAAGTCELAVPGAPVPASAEGQ